MRKKGFTLIELLAVIVILAIIALIAVPIVLGIIDDVKKRSQEESINMYGKAIEIALANYLLKNPSKLGNIFLSQLEEENLINYKGEKVSCKDVRMYENGKIYLGKCNVKGVNTEHTYGEKYVPDVTLGVEFNLESDSSKGERINDSKNFKNDYVIVDSFVNGGKNDFDKSYPFSEIRRCNLTFDNNNEINITYEGEKNFKLDGSNGNVMVEIPKFYFKRERENNKERWIISGKKKNGFEVAPMFLDSNGKEIDFAYVAAYDISNPAGTDFDNVYSRSNSNVLNGKTLIQYRRMIDNHGSLFDFATLSTIQMLWTIEFADRDVKEYMQGVGYLPYFGSSNKPSLDTNDNATEIRLTYTDRVQSFRKGQKVIFVEYTNKWNTIGNQNHYITNIEVNDGIATISFTNSVSLKENVTYMTGCPQDTGLTDDLKYHTGRVLEENNLSPFRYRYIENLWGNSWNIVEGLRVKSLKYYYTYDQTKYADLNVNNWVEYPISVPEQPYLGDDGNNRAWITQAGYSDQNKNIILPSKTIEIVNNKGIDANKKYYSAALYTIYQTDRYGNSVTDPDGIYVCTNGGGYDHNILASPFTLRFWMKMGSEASTLHSTRLVVRE